MKLYKSEKEEEEEQEGKKNQYKISAKICSFRIKVRNMNTKGRREKKEKKNLL